MGKKPPADSAPRSHPIPWSHHQHNNETTRNMRNAPRCQWLWPPSHCIHGKKKKKHQHALRFCHFRGQQTHFRVLFFLKTYCFFFIVFINTCLLCTINGIFSSDATLPIVIYTIKAKKKNKIINIRNNGKNMPHWRSTSTINGLWKTMKTYM